MRRFLLLFAAVFLSLAAVAEELTKIQCLFGSTYNSKGITTYSGSFEAKNDGYTWVVNCCNNNNNGWDYVKAGKGANIVSKTAIKETITQVGLVIDAFTIKNVSNISLEISSDENFTTKTTKDFTIATGEQVVTIDDPSANKYYKVVMTCTDNKAVTISAINFYYSSAALLFDQESVELTYGDVFAAPTLKNADGKTINWESSNTDVATVDGSGNVEIKGIGTTKITATDASDNTNTASYTITVKDPNAIEDDVIKHGIFDGEAGSAYAKEGSYTSGNGIIYKARYSNTNGIQLNKNTASPGIVVTENPHGYVLSKIIVEWNSKGTAGRDLEIIGSNEPFNGPTDLNATEVGAAVTKGKILGTLSSPNETEFDVLATGYYCYIGLRATSTINMDKITLVWTRVEPEFKADITIAVDETEGDANNITFRGLQESHGLAFDFTGYSVYLNGTEIGGTDGDLSYLPFLPTGNFTISNGTYTYPITVTWPDLAGITAKITNVKYWAWKDKEHATGTEGYWYLDAEYTVAADTELELAVEYEFTGNASGVGHVKTVTGNTAYVEGIGWFSVETKTGADGKEYDVYEYVTDAAGDFKVTPKFPLFVKNALNDKFMAPEGTTRTVAIEGATLMVEVEKVAQQPDDTEDTGNISGVESVVVDSEGAVEYYNLQGVRVEGALTPGIYIRRTATGTGKVAIR